MPNNDYQPPKHLSFGKGRRPGERPPSAAGGKGQIGTNWSYENFSRRKKVLIFSLLAFPYTLITIICFTSGNSFVGYAFLGLAVFVMLIMFLLYMMEKNDF